MGLNSKGYYRLTDILKHRAQINIIYGTRAPGKSYAVKERALKYAWEHKTVSLAYIRRFAEDVKNESVSKYFAERGKNLIKEITGEYDHATVYRGYIYFARYDEEGKEEKGPRFGECFALSLCERYKSTGHPEIKHFICEEFLTDGNYLKDEPLKFMNLVSTIARFDDDVEIYLIGNTISRVCPFFSEWSLTGIPKQKVGTIDTYEFSQETGEIVKIAVEYCPPTPHKSKLFFGRAEKSIQGSAWESGYFPTLPEALENYEEIYCLTYISISGFKFTVKLLIHNTQGYPLVFVYPAKHISERVITGAFSDDIFTTPCLDRNNPAEVLIHNCIVDNKIVYSNNLTGQDFTNSIKAELKNPF